MVATQNKNDQHGVYKQQNVLTAGPGELTLMLYDACIKNLKLGKIYIQEANIQKTHDTLVRAQEIIAELLQTLDMQYDISHQLAPLYEFIMRTIAEANMKKDTKKCDDALGLVIELRDTWQQVIKMTRQSGFAGRGASSSSFAAVAE